MLEAVTLTEIEKIFEITDRMGIHREQLVIPLRPRTPGGVRRLPNGKIEIVVDSHAELGGWLQSLEAQLRALSG